MRIDSADITDPAQAAQRMLLHVQASRNEELLNSEVKALLESFSHLRLGALAPHLIASVKAVGNRAQRAAELVLVRLRTRAAAPHPSWRQVETAGPSWSGRSWTSSYASQRRGRRPSKRCPS